MTSREIHINYLPKHDGLIKSFIDDNHENYIICNEHLRDIILDLDIENKIQREVIINKISELVLSILRNKYLKDYIWDSYTKLSGEEKLKVYQEAKFLIDKKQPFIINTIYNKLDDFMDVGECLDIEGFFRFRMKDFMIYISIISDIALEEYFIKRDKNQFINTLKYFIETQESKIELLRIHMLKDGSLKFYNRYNREIRDLQNKDFLNVLNKSDLDYDDIIISVLLALCPRKVEIIDDLNNGISLEIIDNMKSLFKENLSVVIRH